MEENVDEKTKIYVYVTGEVKVRGVVILDEGSRISDAIEASGGITENADISKINLVYVLSDGMKVIKTIIKMFKDFKPRQFFWLISLIFVVIGLLVGIPVITEFFRTGFITKVPSAILATGIMIFALIIAQCGVILDTVVKQNREKYELELLRYTQIENFKNRATEFVKNLGKTESKEGRTEER